jgi:hypothetical protein
MDNKSQLQISTYKNFGERFYDSVSFASMFRQDQPFRFGVKAAKLFSSSTSLGMSNKRWNFMTMAQGNYSEVPGGTNEYTWEVAGDGVVEYIVTRKLTTSTTPGKNHEEFEIGLDKPYLGEPVLLKGDKDNAPLLKMIGQSRPDTADFSWIYTVKIQDGDPNSSFPAEALEVGSSFVRVSTQVSDEQNTKYGMIEFGSTESLGGVVGQFANEIGFSDKFIRAELEYASGGQSNNQTYKGLDGKMYRSAFSSGHIIYGMVGKPGDRGVTGPGTFISTAERMVLDRTHEDREMMAEFGRLEITEDQDSRRVIKSAPGWFQLAKDGQYWPHSGSFTLNELYQFMHQILQSRTTFRNRKPVICSGTGGVSYLSELIAARASTFQTLEPGFAIRKNANPIGVHDQEYEYGFQFTRIKFPMGIDVTIMYDPRKDDSRIFREKAPGSFLPKESFNYDIFEFGEIEGAPDWSNGKNITMVVQRNADYFFSVANAVDWKTGQVTDGSNVYRFSKDANIYYEISGSPQIWDISACGRIEWVD